VLPETDRVAWMVMRLLLATLVCGGLALVNEEALVRHAIPAIQAWLGVIDSTYRTVDLRLERLNNEWMIVRLATPAVAHALGGHVVAADPRSLMSGSAAAGIVLQPFILAVALLWAWPVRTHWELPLRVVLALPLIVLVALLDVPLMLYGFIWMREISTFEPDRFSLLVIWADFMNAGGRFALTVMAVVATILMARTFTRGSVPRVHPDAVAVPCARHLPPLAYRSPERCLSQANPPFPVHPGLPATVLPDVPPSPPPARVA